MIYFIFLGIFLHYFPIIQNGISTMSFLFYRNYYLIDLLFNIFAVIFRTGIYSRNISLMNTSFLLTEKKKIPPPSRMNS